MGRDPRGTHPGAARFACAASWGVGGLIAARVVQGAGGGMILPLSQAIIARAAGPERLGRMMAVLGVPAMLGPVLGPVAGGLLLDHAGWRWIFLINLPLCLAALLAAAKLLPRDVPFPATAVVPRATAGVPAQAAPAAGPPATADTGTRARPDVVGLGLLPAGCVALVYGLAEAGRGGAFGGGRVLIPLVMGMALLAGFAVHAGRARVVPLIDLRLFRHRGFAGPVVVIFLSGVALFGAIALVPLYFQQVRGATALESGLLIAPQGLGMGVALVVAGRLADRLPPRPIVLTGLVLITAANLYFTRLTAETGRGGIAAALVISGLGLGATLVPVMAAPFRVLAPAEIPRASTAIRVFQQLGAAFAGAVVAVALQRAPSAGAAPAEAFGSVFRWLTGASVIALLAALLIPATRPQP